MPLPAKFYSQGKDFFGKLQDNRCGFHNRCDISAFKSENFSDRNVNLKSVILSSIFIVIHPEATKALMTAGSVTKAFLNYCFTLCVSKTLQIRDF